MSALSFLEGGGEMGGRIRGYDWGGHALGLPEHWPQSLRTVLRLMLTTNHPVFVFWGPKHYCFYNDAYRASIGEEKHPKMLGAEGREMWEEIWHIIGPQIELVLSGEGATWHEDHHIPIIRHGGLQEVYWTYGFSPIDDSSAASGIGGVLVVCTETTQKVLNERRLKLQLELTEKLRGLRSISHVTALSAEKLGVYLGVGRAGFGEVDESGEWFTVENDWTDGIMPSLAGRIRLPDFGEEIVREFQNGRTVRIEDPTKDTRTIDSVTSYEQIGSVRAGIAVPFLKDGKFVAAFYVHQSTPRRWLDEDEILIRDFAERTWSAIERVRAEQAVRSLNDQLEGKVAERTAELLAMNEQLHGFTYTVAHDLRQEIRGISANAALLKVDAGEALDQETRDHLDRLIHSSRQLALLVDELLNYARLGRQAPLQKQIDMTELGKSIGAKILSERDFKSETIIQVEADLVAKGDAAMIGFALQNLIDNACKFSQLQDAPFILVSKDEHGFFVEDNGIGFEMAFADRIFEPFERLHRQMRYPGTGIGLANVKRVIEKHGGKVWAESQPNKGSRFYFWLP
jgi:signal transduction histidine kinase